MIRGIGTDIVSIKDMSELISSLSEGALGRMFTEKELLEASNRKDMAEYLSGRLASKEACFKALSPSLGDRTFDLRKIETLSREDGSPYINITDELKEALKRADISAIKISISHDNGIAIAFAIAER